jgi:molecular chaperone HtpG
MANNKTETQQFEFKAEMKQLLHLIIHSLYTHPEVFLRELISNASDALNKVRFRELTDKSIVDAGEELKITIELDEKRRTFSITDNGIGMTKDELVNNIGTIARSGTVEFLQTLKSSKTAVTEENLIGKFGVGFYSCFMVTDKVTIETRSAQPDSEGYRWQSHGEGSFTIDPLDRKERGTTITFTLKEDQKQFSELYTVKNVIKKYSNFVDFPISIGKEKVNTVTALWHKKSAEITDTDAHEFYKFISNDYEAPLGYFHHAIEGNVNFKALLFIPKTEPLDFMQLRDEKSLHLYCNKVLIQDDCKDLVPEYLRFVKGVVDTEDLPLNVSREVTQSSPVMLKIRQTLTNKIFAFLENWAASEKEKYEEFYRKFGPLFKTGINSDFTNRDKIIELLRFETSKTKKGELISLKEYTLKMASGQKELYYFSGETREIIEKNPNLEYFVKNDIEVIFLTHPVDIFILPSVREYDKKPLTSIDKAELDAIKESKISTPENKLDDSLLKLFKETLGERIEDVKSSKRLVDSPVTLVQGKESMDAQMEKMMKMMNKDFIAAKKVLEVNLEHPLVKNLARRYLANAGDPMITTCIEQLYEGALFLDGSLKTPTDFLKRMTDIMTEATS